MPKIDRLYNIFRWNIDLQSIAAINQGVDECTINFLYGGSIVIFRTHRVSISDPEAGWVEYELETFKAATTNLIKAWEIYNATTNSQTES
jgi:hypothetical protein